MDSNADMFFGRTCRQGDRGLLSGGAFGACGLACGLAHSFDYSFEQ